MKKVFTFFLIILICYSCTKKNSKFERELTSNKWYYYTEWKISQKVDFYGYTVFYSDGKYKDFSSLSETEIVPFEERSEYKTWLYDNKEKIFSFNSSRYRVVNFKNDTIYLINISDNFKCMLFKK